MSLAQQLAQLPLPPRWDGKENQGGKSKNLGLGQFNHWNKVKHYNNDDDNDNNSNNRKTKRSRSGEKQYSCSPPTRKWFARPQAAVGPSQPIPRSFYTGRDVPRDGASPWPVSICSPGHGPPSLLCPSLLAVHGKLSSLWLRVSTAQQHQCVSSTLILNPNHSTVPAPRKKITSIPAKITTGRLYFISLEGFTAGAVFQKF